MSLKVIYKVKAVIDSHFQKSFFVFHSITKQSLLQHGKNIRQLRLHITDNNLACKYFSFIIKCPLKLLEIKQNWSSPFLILFYATSRRGSRKYRCMVLRKSFAYHDTRIKLSLCSLEHGNLSQSYLMSLYPSLDNSYAQSRPPKVWVLSWTLA